MPEQDLVRTLIDRYVPAFDDYIGLRETYLKKKLTCELGPNGLVSPGYEITSHLFGTDVSRTVDELMVTGNSNDPMAQIYMDCSADVVCHFLCSGEQAYIHVDIFVQ